MNPQIATVIFVIGLLALFALNWESGERTSKALWISFAWLAIGASRNVSEWLQIQKPANGTDAYMEGNPLDRNVLTALLVLGLIVLVRRRRETAAFAKANVPIILYFVYCGLSIFWADYPSVAAKRWFRGLGDLVIVALVVTDAHKLSAIKRLLSRVGFLLLPASLLLTRYYPDLGRMYNRWEGTLALTGVTTDKNSLGMICMIFGLASAWRFLEAYGQKGSSGRMGVLVAHGSLVVLALWLIHTADSATALVCFLIGGAILVFARRPTVARRPRRVHLFVVTILSLIVAVLFLDIGAVFVQNLGRNSTLTGRTDIWRLVLGMVTNPWLGTGYENFWLGQRIETMRHIYYNNVNEAHNGYLEIYLNLGWVGVTLLAIAMFSGYRKIVAAVRRQVKASNLLLAYFVIACIYNCTEAGFKMMHPVWIALLLAITIVPQASSHETPDAGTEVVRIPVYQEVI